MSDYDAIVVGGGHNGLVAAAYLAKGSLKTLNLEKNSFVGGHASTQELFEGFKFNLGAHVWGLTRPQIVKELEVEKFGFERINPEVMLFNPFPNGKYFAWYSDPEKSIEGVARDFSSKDAEGFRKYIEFWSNFAKGVGLAFLNPPVSMSKLLGMFTDPKAADDMRKAFFYSASEFIDPLIDSEELKGAICYWGADGNYAGPMTPGTNFSAGFHFASGEPYGCVKGGIGMYSEALRKCIESYGGTVRLNSPVKKVLLEKNKAIGVKLDDGEEITAKVVLSNVDAQSTFLRLVDPESLPGDFVEMIKSMKFRTAHVQIFCALDELPDYKALPGKGEGIQRAAGVVISPSVRYIEEAWDDCKYGRPSKHPIMFVSIPSVFDPSLAPKGKHAANLYAQFCPYDLAEGDWDTVKESFADLAVDTFNEYAPNFKKSIIHREVCSPVDYERKFGITKGNFWHGEMTVDQIFDWRPAPGWSNYRTPIERLYLCGCSAHPGGGVNSGAGHNCAQVVLEDWKKGKLVK